MRTGACFFVAIFLLGCGRTDVYWYQPGGGGGRTTRTRRIPGRKPTPGRRRTPVIWLVGARRLGPGQWAPIVARFDEGGWAEVYP